MPTFSASSVPDVLEKYNKNTQMSAFCARNDVLILILTSDIPQSRTVNVFLVLLAHSNLSFYSSTKMATIIRVFLTDRNKHKTCLYDANLLPLRPALKCVFTAGLLGMLSCHNFVAEIQSVCLLYTSDAADE